MGKSQSGREETAERQGQTPREPYMHLGFVVDREHIHRWERNADGSIALTRLDLNRGSNRCVA